jgi:hypothetical protein
MRTRVAIIVALLAVAATPSLGLAKGAIGANINGPGIGGGIRMNGSGESGSGSRLGALAESSGFFAQAYGMQPSPLQSRPEGDLGPRYVVRYTMEPGNSGVIVQHIYPFAKGGPVTFMAAGQTFYGTESTKGGWFRATSNLIPTLESIGIPKTAPASAATDSSKPTASEAREPETTPSHREAASSSSSWMLFSIVAVAALSICAGGAWAVVRRRPGSSATAA